MKKIHSGFIILLAVFFLSACNTILATPTPTVIPPTPRVMTLPTLIPSATLAPSSTPLPTWTPVPTLDYPPAGYGPTNFPPDINPLTGLKVSDPAVLDRRPIVIKVENLPREHRPQYGLSLADLVFEYYTEQGGTRFAGVYYGQNAEMVGPIRSGRFFDVSIVQMYRGIFIFGSAYSAVWNRFVNSDFYDRMLLENQFSCPALCRFEPKGRNLLVANTIEVANYAKSRAVDNSRQVLDGMYFQLQPPPNGDLGNQVYVRYSGAIYNRWDYDAASGRYLRYEDTQNDVNRNNEVYAQLTDQLNSKPIAADNVVTFCVAHEYYFKSDQIEVVDMLMQPGGGSYVACDGKSYPTGSGPAWLARDGKMYQVTYLRAKKDAPLSLIGADGQPFPYKPGQTWYEVIGASSSVEQETPGVWRFTFRIVP